MCFFILKKNRIDPLSCFFRHPVLIYISFLLTFNNINRFVSNHIIWWGGGTEKERKKGERKREREDATSMDIIPFQFLQVLLCQTCLGFSEQLPSSRGPQ